MAPPPRPPFWRRTPKITKGFLLFPVGIIDVVARAITPDRFANTAVVFLTGTAAEVTLLGEIDHHRFTPGDITKAMMQVYEKATGQTSKEAASAAE